MFFLGDRIPHAPWPCLEDVQEWNLTWFPRYRGYSSISDVAAVTEWTVINASHNMSTSHPPNVYTSNYHHQLASQPHHQPPPASYQHQSYPTANHHPSAPLQIARSGSRDSASSDQPSPKRDGRDPYANRERREAWDPRLERKIRPATIAELADKSREDLWDPNKHLKHWLRTAELARKSGKQYAENGDYERSFVQLARAASIILEKMPTHKDYRSLLTESQRNNLVLVSFSLSLSTGLYLPLLPPLFLIALPGSYLPPAPVISLFPATDPFNFDTESHPDRTLFCSSFSTLIP